MYAWKFPHNFRFFSAPYQMAWTKKVLQAKTTCKQLSSWSLQCMFSLTARCSVHLVVIPHVVSQKCHSLSEILGCYWYQVICNTCTRVSKVLNWHKGVCKSELRCFTRDDSRTELTRQDSFYYLKISQSNFLRSTVTCIFYSSACQNVRAASNFAAFSQIFATYFTLEFTNAD